MTMTLLKTLLLALALVPNSGNAFVIQQQQQRSHPTLMTNTKLNMGLFDFLMSDEEKQARAEAKRREIEEQERLQKAILERRRNPELMEEYEAKVRVRRNFRMQGMDEQADKMDLYKESEQQTLLDGTDGLK